MLLTLPFVAILLAKIYKKGARIDHIFILGSVVLFVFGIVSLISQIFEIHENPNFIFQIGVVIELIIFNIGLGVRSRYHEKEKLKAQTNLINQLEENEQLQRDEAIRSIGIASQTLMLAAKSAGYDSCPMIGFDYKAVADLINLPKNYVIGMMLVIGKAKTPANSRGGQLPLNQVVFTDRF